MFKGKTILITGVSSGIGAETARQAHASGAVVIGIDRAPPKATVAHFHQIDLSDPAAIASLALALALPDRLDALINIAGVPGTAGADLLGRVNFLGLRELTELVAPKLKRGGAIVNLASIAGAEWPQRLALHKELAATVGFEAGQRWLEGHPVSDDFCYPYFKEALIVWTALRSQHWWRSRGVRMNCVSPGPVDTPILADFRASLGDARAQGDIDRVGRPATPADIAPVVLFLCSDEAGWVNGVNLPTDGGLATTFV